MMALTLPRGEHFEPPLLRLACTSVTWEFVVMRALAGRGGGWRSAFLVGLSITLSVGRVCHTLPWGLRKVLGRNTLSLLLLDSDFLVVTLFSCLFLPAGSNGDINFKPKLQPHAVFFSRRLFVLFTCLKFPALLCYDLLIIKFILSVNTILILIIGGYSYHDPDGRT